MRLNFSVTVFHPLVLLLLLLQPVSTRAEITAGEAAKNLPERIGSFRARGSALLPLAGVFERISAEEVDATSHAARSYVGANGNTFVVDLVRVRMESAAYALLTNSGLPFQDVQLGIVGTAGNVGPNRIVFFKGRNFVQVYQTGTARWNQDELIGFARAFATSLDGGENDIPVLVKHLPDWQAAGLRAVYAVSLQTLKGTLPNQPVFDAVGFEGGAEAVAAHYGPSQLVIVEFSTPQLAVDNNWNIRVKIRELSSQGKPAPTAYRRVGNYAVFVFNAPNEQTANQLIDQVKYEQLVQWLGDNPNWLKEAQRRYTETMLGTFVSVVKASGLAAVLCFGVGGFCGALLFTRRRAQQATQGAYSDAGGMMRLNIDELTSETEPRRLLGPGKP